MLARNSGPGGRRRRLASGLIVTAILVTAGGLVPAVSLASSGSAGPEVVVRAGELVNLADGATLWAHDANTERAMGSITKVMTALLVLRAGHLGRKIKVSEGAVKYASNRGASSAGLIAGDILTARELLEAMLLPSGCDAAYLLATAYGPGRAAFIARMNAAAQAMGMTRTHFSWFDGMPYPTEHSTYSTASNLITLGEHAMRYRLFREIVAQRTFYLPAGDGHHAYRWHTTNGLIGSYRGAIGIKTGETDAAGDCLLFEARRGRITLIGVVLRAVPSSNPVAAINAARQVLNWGFARA